MPSLSRRMAASSALLLLLLLLMAVVVATEMAPTKAARTCLSSQSQSRTFKGACVSSIRCARVCKAESFPDGGECKGTQAFDRKRGLEGKCFCNKKQDC